jgi:hypothetical protein
MVLWLLPVLGLMLLQTYLVFREPIFTPVDELQHTDYVRTIAEQGRLPIYGQAEIDPTLLAVYMHQYPQPFDATGYQLPKYIYLDYEALQFPLYYIVAAPVYRLFDRDPRVAIYALRMENVIFSGALLLMLMLILRFVFPTRADVAVLAPLAFLTMPGMSLRHSQVTNQVLAALLLAALFALLVHKWKSGPRRSALVEGAIFGVAVMTKITVIGAGPGVLAAWATRTGGLRQRLAVGAAGLAITMVPWLVWSLAVYHFPLPWVTTHVDLSFCPCPLPTTRAAWDKLLHDTLVSFVLPIEYAGPGFARTTPMRVALIVVPVLLTAALAWGLYALRDRRSELWRPALLAVLSLFGVAVGILALDIPLNRFTSTDLREIYVFAAPLVILLGGLAARLPRSWVLLLGTAILVLWLLIDYQIYTTPGCPGCPPQWFKLP